MSLTLSDLDPAVAEFCHRLSGQLSAKNLHELVDDFASLKVLLVGDTIIDRYAYVRVQGLTSKSRILSARYVNRETQAGGALAVFRHLKQFTPHVKFLSLVGTEPWVDEFLGHEVPPEQDLLVRDPNFTTIIKERFVEPLSRGKELAKLFAVNFIDADPPSAELADKVRRKLAAEIKHYDLVVLADFGHGLLQPALRDFAQDNAPFLALNCQTNSNNHGFNIITRQYRRMDAFSLDAQELMLACGHQHPDFVEELDGLRRQFGSRYAWLTRGPVETIGLTEGEPPSLCPPLEVDVVDTVGAGDAFFSVAALAAVRKLPIAIGTFLGQLAGAQAVRVVGNARPISKSELLRAGATLLSLTKS